jgi:intraflagellar transport protein 81
VERHLAANNPTDDKLAPFRQQAAIIARKKETTAEQLTELKNKLSAVEEELQVKYCTVIYSHIVRTYDMHALLKRF